VRRPAQQPQPSRLTRLRRLPRSAQFMQRAVEKERVVVAETAEARRVRRAARAAAPPQALPGRAVRRMSSRAARRPRPQAVAVVSEHWVADGRDGTAQGWCVCARARTAQRRLGRAHAAFALRHASASPQHCHHGGRPQAGRADGPHVLQARAFACVCASVAQRPARRAFLMLCPAVRAARSFNVETEKLNASAEAELARRSAASGAWRRPQRAILTFDACALALTQHATAQARTRARA
jgi:hypothetical protein